MLKIFILVSIIFQLYTKEVFASGPAYNNDIKNLLRHVKSKYQHLGGGSKHVGSGVAEATTTTCLADADCLEGYFCKNSDCVAKRAEGSLCLSGRNEECLCGQCSLNQDTWERVCMTSSDIEACPNDGVTKHNTCKNNHECPRGHFCDHQDGNVCKSLQASGRMCSHDSMCSCGKCSQVTYKPMANRAPIVYNVCAECS